MSDHFITKCEKCLKVMRQCRCPSENKHTTYEICNECSVVHTCPECKKIIECSKDHCNYSIIFKCCLDCLAKKQSMPELKKVECEGVGDNNSFYEIEVPDVIAYRGPSVTWNKDDLRKMVDAFGLEDTIDRVAGEQFQRPYAEKLIKQILEL